ncbi:MAG: winged helix-turn-helix domain-containing protein [Ardenticatenaceae bacterium]|nr:winged helix-turn-helix domain-containing protein [Ardenticatenaceae bacterium]
MKRENQNSVLAAFELLLEEVEDEIELVNQAGAKAFGEGDYEQVDTARQQAVRLTDYRRKIADLRKEWESISATFAAIGPEDKSSRRDLGRLQRGIRTPEEAFRLPILQTLVEMGGSGIVREVLTQVEKMLRQELSDADYETLPSTPNTPRWYNTAQWARNSMVNEGLLRDNSPRGTWEISEKGRDYLQGQRQ